MLVLYSFELALGLFLGLFIVLFVIVAVGWVWTIVWTMKKKELGEEATLEQAARYDGIRDDTMKSYLE